MSITLKPHNIVAYEKVKENFEKNNRTAVIHPTGTGKSYIALKMLEENKGKKAIYIAPSNAILHGIKNSIFESGMNMTDFPNLKRMTYQKLMNLSDEEIKKSDFDIIVLDEFHHCGAPEWGNGVSRLLDNNPNANILGLSATPIRYFDGLRDMSDELFDGNVASEMTLEEAIDKDILPDATYVSTLYGYNEELEDMKKNIESISNQEKKKQAEKLYLELSKKLDENTKNLPELLSTYMKNRNGKYIVFCRNIEDMKEKMSKANEMFGNINSNIHVYGVSSDKNLKRNDKTLTEFENDNNEDTLKLMYAVDMLNEGYHINNLDGVVMMRPTLSPTIFTQQLGRALSVGGNNKPVILDLVNNFDSCKIIEDFSEKMKNYGNSSNNPNKESKQESGLSIFDTTREFREIAQKIKELSKTKILIDEKIAILKRFYKTHREITGKTIFEGHPIGQWAIQIRSDMKRYKNGIKSSINLTEEQIEELNSMGIFESIRENNTIDEKIEGLLEWIRKYPNIKPIQREIPFDKLEQFKDDFKDENKDPENYLWDERAKKEYQKVYRYYDYLKKIYRELTDEQKLRCKEENVGGIFGYSTNIEKIAKEYKQDEDITEYIINKYGSFENFIELYEKESHSYSDDNILNPEDPYLGDVGLKHGIDIDCSKNELQYNNIISQFLAVSPRNKALFYSSNAINKVLESFAERERICIINVFGLEDGIPKTYKEIGEAIGVSHSRVGQIFSKAMRRFINENTLNMITIDGELTNNEENLLSEEERKEYKKLKKLVYVNARLKPSSKYCKEPEIEDNNKKNITMYFKYVKYLKRQIEVKELKNKLNIDRNNIKDKLNNLKKSKDEELVDYWLYSIDYDKKKDEINRQRYLETPIEDLHLSVRSFNALKRIGIITVGDMVEGGKENLFHIRNLGRKSFDEIKSLLDSMRLDSSNDEVSNKLLNDGSKDKDYEENREKFDYIKYLEVLDLEEAVKIIEDLYANIGDETFNGYNMGLSPRASNAISRCGTVRETIKLSADGKLKSLRNIGDKTIDEINSKLKSMGFVVPKDKNGKYGEEDLEKLLYMKVKDAIKLFEPRFESIGYLIERFKVKGIESKGRESVINENREKIEQWKQKKIQEYTEQLKEIDEKLKEISSEKLENPLEQKDAINTKKQVKEKKEDNKPNSENSEAFSELEKLKNDKEALEKYVKEQEEKIRKAKGLLVAYGEFSNDDISNSDNDNPSFKDD